MTGAGTSPGLDYRAAGVDVAAGDRAVEMLRAHVGSTARPEVLGGLGGFAGLFAPDLSRVSRPVLAAASDGVGTKLAVARAVGRHDTVGVDLVAMVVDDLVVCGAEPLFLLDYVAVGRLDPQWLATVVGGVAAGCRLAGCALLGGETAEHPGVMAPDDYDLAGFGVGLVDADAVLGPERTRAGDAVVAMAASGLHANGFSLVRAAVAAAGLDYREPWAPLDADRPLGEVLLEPTRVYARDCLALARAVDVHAFAHVTGGGLAANLARSVGAGLAAHVDRATWSPPPVVRAVARLGGVTREEAERTFHAGIGMAAVVAAHDAADAVALLRGRGVPAWVCGELTGAEPGAPGRAALHGDHPAA